MNLQRFEQTPLLVEISDMLPGIKRKALFRRLEVCEDLPSIPNSVSNNPTRGSITIFLTIQHFFATQDNGYGEPYSSLAIRDYDYTIIANGNDFVDGLNGSFLKAVSDVTDDDSAEGGIFYNKTVMFDNEFFRLLSYNSPVIVMQLVEQFIQEHAVRGKFPK